jgi:pyrroloquinoline-quinone synthase
MDLTRFESVELLPAAARYRWFLDEVTELRGWEVGAAVTTLFVEGTRWERAELEAEAPRRPEPPLERHPLVVHYGLPVERLALTRAHRAVEGSHRLAAWSVVLDHVEAAARARVVEGVEQALAHWLEYRDDVARACGVEQAENGDPVVRGAV